MAENEKPVTGVNMKSELEFTTKGYEQTWEKVKTLVQTMEKLVALSYEAAKIPQDVKGVGLKSELEMKYKQGEIVSQTFKEAGKWVVLLGSHVEKLQGELEKLGHRQFMKGQVEGLKKLSEGLDNELRLRTRAGDVKVKEIRALQDIHKLKLVISELETMQRQREGRSTQDRLKAAQEQLIRLKEETAVERKNLAEQIRLRRLGAPEGKFTSVAEYKEAQATAAKDAKALAGILYSAEKVVSDQEYREATAAANRRMKAAQERQRLRDAERKEAQATAAKDAKALAGILYSAEKVVSDQEYREATAAANRRMKAAEERQASREQQRRIGTGRELPESYKDLQQRQRVQQQKFSVIDIARAENEKLIPTLAQVAKATDLVWLQEEKRYAGIRKRRGFNQQAEQELLNAIRSRLKELSREPEVISRATAAAKRKADEAAAREAEAARKEKYGLSLTPSEETRLNRNRVRAQRASLQERSDAKASKFSLEEVKASNDKLGLAMQARYAKIRQGLALTEEERKAELALQQAIQGRLKLLAQEERAAQKPAAPVRTLTEAQEYSAAVQRGRLQMSKYTNKTAPNLSSLSLPELNALKQGQQSRLLSGKGRGSQATVEDAVALIARIQDQQEARRQAKADVRKAAKDREEQDLISKGEALPSDQQKRSRFFRTQRQKASLEETYTAYFGDKWSMERILASDDKLQLRLQARYSKIRQGMLLKEEDIKQEMAYQKVIEKQLSTLEKRDRVLTATQEHSAAVQQGRLKMSQYTSLTAPALSGLSQSELNALKQGQQSRYLAATGRGDGAQAQDAIQLLGTIKAHEESLAELKRKNRAEETRAIREQSQTEQQKANRAYQIQVAIAALRSAEQLDVRKLNSLAEVGLQIDAAKLRAKRAIAKGNDHLAEQEDELIRRLRVHQQVLARQAEDPADRARINEFRRQDTRERLFGDGGASTLAVQAGLMLNYQLLGGLQSLFSGAISSAVEFDAALKQLQAISAATRNEMGSLKDALIEVAQGSRFSAAEVAQASVLLAQAGLSITEIRDTMQAVIQLATASGSELKKSVDVMTSVLSVFDMSAGKSEEIANKLTAALNQSKLDIDKMALGLQYAGNAAADAGISFDELVAGLSAMSNAGIRSGSTLGTGLRQLFVDIQKPSGKFKEILERLGLTMDEVNIRTQGFEGVLRNLQERGFTVADAFQSFQIRSASAFAALSNNINTFHEMQSAIDGTNAALEANAIQMESLSVQYDHLKSNLGIVAAEGLKPLLTLLRDVTAGFAHMLEGVDKNGATLKVVFTGLAAAGIALATAIGGNLLVGLIQLGGGFSKLITLTGLSTVATRVDTASKSLNALATNTMMVANQRAAAGATATAAAIMLQAKATNAAAFGVRTLSVALSLLKWTPLFLGLTVAASAFGAFSSETEKLTDTLDEAKTAANSTAEAVGKYQQQIEQVDRTLTTLADRYGRLSNNSRELQDFTRELAREFREMGVDITDLAGKSVQELIDKMKELRENANVELRIKIREDADARKAMLQAQQAADLGKAAELAKTGAVQARRATGSQVSPEADLARQAYSYVNYGTLPSGMTPAGLSKAIRDAEAALAKTKANPLLQKALANSSRALDYYQMTRGRQEQLQNLPSKELQDLLTVEKRTAAQANAASGFNYAIQARSALSNENTLRKDTGGASIDYLETGIAGIQKTKAYYEGIRKASDAISKRRQLSEDELANLAVANEQIEELAKVESDYQNQLAPKLEKARDAALTAAQTKLKLAQAEVENTKRLISTQGNERRVQEVLEARLKKQMALVTQLENDVQAAARGLTKEEIAAIRAQLGRQQELTAEEAKNIADARERQLRDFRNDQQQLAGGDEMQQAFSRVKASFEALDTTLTEALDERSSKLLARAKQLQSQLLDAQLMGAGIPSSGTTSETDATELGFRRRVAGRFQQASLKRQLERERRAAAREQFSAIGEALPGLEHQAGEQKNLLAQLTAKRDQARSAWLAEKDRQDEISKGTGSISQEELDKLKQLADSYRILNEMTTEQERTTKSQLAAISEYQNKRLELAGSITADESQFGLLFDSIKAGVAGLESSFSDLFHRIISGTGDTREAFEEMGRGILSAMLKVITDKIAQQFVEMLVNFGGSFFSGPTPQAAAPSALGDFNVGSMQVARTGGPILRRSTGGYVPGTLQRDAVPALLMPGEFVLQKSASEALGQDFLHGLNRQTSATVRQGAERAKQAMGETQPPAAPGTVNVWVVTPDQQAGMGKDDIIVTVSDNIARGGTLRRLIKQVQVGG